MSRFPTQLLAGTKTDFVFENLEPADGADFVFENTESATGLSPIRQVYKDRLERVRSAGSHIQKLRNEADQFEEGSEDRAKLDAEADEAFTLLDQDRREFFEKRHDDIFLEGTPIARLPIGNLGYGASEFFEGNLNLGATAASMFYRSIGANSQADAVVKGMNELRKYNDILAKRELGSAGQVFGHVIRGLSELGPIGKAGSLAGKSLKEIGKMTAGYSAIKTTNESLTEGTERGLKGADLAGYALSQGASDYILGSAANEWAIKLGGSIGEVITPMVVNAANKFSFGKIARDFLATTSLEALPNGAQSLMNNGLRLVYGVGDDVTAERVLNEALLATGIGAVSAGTTTSARYAKVAVDNYGSTVKGWMNRVKGNKDIKSRVENSPESVRNIKEDKEPRTVELDAAGYGPAFQVKKLAIGRLRNLPPDSANRVLEETRLRETEGTLTNIRSHEAGRKGALDYLERELADVDDRINKNEIELLTLEELSNEMIQKPVVPETLKSERENLANNLASMTEEQKRLTALTRERAGIFMDPPAVKNAKARLKVMEPEIEAQTQRLLEVEQEIAIHEGEIAAANATTQKELDSELTRLADEHQRTNMEKELIQGEVKLLGDAAKDSPVLSKIKAPEVDQPTDQLVKESGDFQLEALRQRSVNELRDEFGFDKMSTTDRISMEAALQSAVEKGIPDRALEIATAAIATRQPMSMEEVVGTGFQVKRLGVQHFALDRAMRTLPDTPESNAALDGLDAQMKQIEGEVNVLTEALYHTGSDAARAMAARTHQSWLKLWGPRFKNRMERAKGAPLTENEKTKVDDLIRQINEMDDKRKVLDPRSDEFFDISFDRQKLLYDLNWMKGRVEWNSLTGGQRTGKSLAEGMNLWRSVLTSGDGVPILRQGLAFASHPIIMAKSMPLFYRSFVNDKAAFKFDIESKFGRKNSDLYGEGFFSELTDPMSKRDDAVASLLADRLPYLRGTARSYRAWVNRVRADSFDAIVDSNGGRENLTPEQIATIKDVVLNFSGRGGLAGLERSASTMYQALISPRYLASRFATAFNWPAVKALARGDKKAAYIASKEYFKMVTGIAVATYAMEQLGKAFFGKNAVSFTRDPRDPNFGRLRMGDRYVDATASLAMPIRLVSTLIENLHATATGDKRERDFGRALGGVFTSRLTPGPSMVNAMIEGHLYGEDLSGKNLLRNYAVPWPLGSIYEVAEREGYDPAVVTSIFEHFGAGGYYKPPRKIDL